MTTIKSLDDKCQCGRRRFWIFLFILITIACYWGYEEFTGGFRLANISYDFAEKWNSPPPTAEQLELFDQIFNGSFSYLGQGTQSYAFVSSDGKYVLKFFKFGRMRPSVLLENLPDLPWIAEYRQYARERQQNRINRFFKGYKIAYEKDIENNKLLFIHFNRSDYFKKKIIVLDRLGFSHEIDLDDIPFTLQEKAIPTKILIENFLAEGNLNQVKQHIRDLFDMFILEYRKGLVDQDYNVLQNTGFINDKPVRIDVGRMTYDEAFKDPKVYYADLEKIAWKRVDKWFSKYHPEVREEIAQYLREYLDRLH